MSDEEREQAKLKEVFDDLAKDLRGFYLSNSPIKQDTAFEEYQTIMGKQVKFGFGTWRYF